MTHRRFVLVRDEDVTGVSGVGVVAEGVHWPHGDVVALRWTSEWPTSVVFHDRGIASVEAIHGHNGKTRIVWMDEESAEVARLTRERDAALEALKQASDAMSKRGNDLFYLRMESGSDLRPAYRSLWKAARAARQTITSIETGAIHNDQS